AIDVPPNAQAPCPMLYHGTLALRSAHSRATLQTLKSTTTAPVFLDVNLRDPWWDPTLVHRLADDATWVKLNDKELSQLCPGNNDPHTQATRFVDTHGLEGVIVTQGESGAFALLRDGELHTTTPDPASEVIDTVGAGDSFSAVMLLGISREWALEESLARAQSFASLIVKNRGAIFCDISVYQQLVTKWKQ
ncbi:MAG: fructokinase, partial [Gammaproteobacteria bacterium]